MTGVNLTGANLSGADFTGATLTDVILTDANTDGAIGLKQWRESMERVALYLQDAHPMGGHRVVRYAESSSTPCGRPTAGSCGRAVVPMAAFAATSDRIKSARA